MYSLSIASSACCSLRLACTATGVKPAAFLATGSNQEPVWIFIRVSSARSRTCADHLSAPPQPLVPALVALESCGGCLRSACTATGVKPAAFLATGCNQEPVWIFIRVASARSRTCADHLSAPPQPLVPALVALESCGRCLRSASTKHRLTSNCAPLKICAPLVGTCARGGRMVISEYMQLAGSQGAAASKCEIDRDCDPKRHVATPTQQAAGAHLQLRPTQNLRSAGRHLCERRQNGDFRAHAARGITGGSSKQAQDRSRSRSKVAQTGGQTNAHAHAHAYGQTDGQTHTHADDAHAPASCTCLCPHMSRGQSQPRA